MRCLLDHLVILCDTLDDGARWCQDTLGVSPGPGGRHPLMGTHNRLLRLDGPGFPQAHLELLAIDPDAPPPGRPRWFGLDAPGLRAGLRRDGPALARAVLRCPALGACHAALAGLGCPPGRVLAASRDTPAGPLSWRITVRDDGGIGLDGHLPTLIEWSGPHPTDAMPPSPLRLAAVTLGGLPPAVAQALGLDRPTPDAATRVTPGGPALQVQLHTPLGERLLVSRA